MRRSEKQVCDVPTIDEIFRTGQICQLAISTDPAPYIVSLNYGYHDGTLYFHSAREGRKLGLLQANPNVGFTVVVNLGLLKGEQACNWSTNFQSIVGYGQIGFLDNLEEKRKALDTIMAQYSDQNFNYPDDSLSTKSNPPALPGDY